MIAKKFLKKKSLLLKKTHESIKKFKKFFRKKYNKSYIKKYKKSDIKMN